MTKYDNVEHVLSEYTSVCEVLRPATELLPDSVSWSTIFETQESTEMAVAQLASPVRMPNWQALNTELCGW